MPGKDDSSKPKAEKMALRERSNSTELDYSRFGEYEKILFSLSHLTTTTTDEKKQVFDRKADLDKLMETIKFLRSSCAKSREIQDYLKKENIHLLVDGYLRWFWDKEPLVLQECLKFYANFCAKNTENSMEIVDRFFVKGDIGFRLLFYPWTETIGIWMINCFKRKKDVIEMLSKEKIASVMEALVINWSQCPIQGDVFELFAKYLDWPFFLSQKLQEVHFRDLLEILELCELNRYNCHLLDQCFLKLSSEKDPQKVAFYLHVMSKIEIGWDKVEFKMEILKSIFVSSFEKKYDPSLCYQSLILTILTNASYNCSEKANQIVKSELIPLILLCTSISNLDPLRRETAVFLIKVLSLQVKDFDKILKEALKEKDQISFSI